MVYIFEPTFIIGGSKGACLVHAPLWDPILSFLHTFSPKSAHIGGPRPPTGNPGCAIVYEPFSSLISLISPVFNHAKP